MNEIEVNSYGTNKNIKAHILPESKMRKIGFTDHNPNVWYFSKVWDDVDISFNVSIPKNESAEIHIDVLDEMFLQPYDYQYILKNMPSHPIASTIKNRVDEQMVYLIENGVLSNWEVGDYV